MPHLTRRGFLASTAATAALARLPLTAAPNLRPVLTLVYDKSLGMMRAVEKLVPM